MDGSVSDSFAGELRRFRELRGLTQEELADRAGITVKAVGALERGERTRPYPHTVRSLADALGLDDEERRRLTSSVPSRRRSGVASAAAQPVPVPASTLVGREEDVVRVGELVRPGRRRLLSLTGPGGVGKTRLALEVLAREYAGFPGGVAFVDLAAVREPNLVLERLAAALGIPETVRGDTVAGLVPALAGRRLLVVLDNFEHLMEAATTVADLVARCPELVVLVTSRAPLRVRGEHEVRLTPLAVPATDELDQVRESPTAQLFLELVAAAGAPVTLDAGNAPTVAAICRRLDGLPLAVELAAAGARVLTPAALLDRLDQQQSQPAPRDLAERHRSVAAVLDWSLGLLAPEQEALLLRLTTFAGGFTLDAAEAVVESDVLEPLGVLVEQSLVARTASPDDQPRFRLLEPIRQDAGRRLEAVDGTRTADRHARHFHERALAAGPRLHGGADLGLELDRLEADHANLRAAYVRLLERDRVADAAELAGTLWLYLALRGHAREGLTWLDRLDPGAPDGALCLALTGRLGLLFATGQIEAMRADADRAVSLARRLDPGTHGRLAAESLTLAGHAAVFAGDLDQARTLLDEALARATVAESAWAEAHALVALGQQTLMAGHLGEAEAVLTRALETARRHGNPFTLATALTRRATVSTLQGDDVTTAALLGESIALSVVTRMSWTLSYALPALAGVAVRLGEPDTAATLFAASASLSAAQAVDPRFPLSRRQADGDLALARDQLGDRAFRDAWDAGRTASPDEVAELAAELTRLVRD